jgi:hypothetical protein
MNGGGQHEAAKMKRRVRVRPLGPWPRGLVSRGITASCFLPMLLSVVNLPVQASGRERALPAEPVLGLSGSIVILSDPPGARAWIGDRFVGTTPVRADSLAPGRQRVVLAPISPATQWSRPCLVYTDLRAGTPDTLRIDLRGAAGSAPMSDEREPAGAELGAALGAERPPLSRLGTVLPIAALGFGAAGAWSRHSADAAYRDYLRTVDRGRTEDRFFRRANRLDRASVTCWIGAEACLAGAAWVWLRGDGRVPVAASFAAEGGVRLGLRVGGEVPPSSARQRGR